MKFATRLIAASVLATAAAGAFASEYDGVAPDAWLKQTAVSQQVQAPAPVAAAAKADSRITEQTNQAVTP